MAVPCYGDEIQKKIAELNPLQVFNICNNYTEITIDYIFPFCDECFNTQILCIYFIFKFPDGFSNMDYDSAEMFYARTNNEANYKKIPIIPHTFQMGSLGLVTR